MAKSVKQQEQNTIDCDYVAQTPCHFTHDGKNYHLVKGVGYTLPKCTLVKSLIQQGRLKIRK